MSYETLILKQGVQAHPVPKNNLKIEGRYFIFQKKCDFAVCPIHIDTS
jgi:hypothetical protein